MHIVVVRSCVFSAPFQSYQSLVEGMLIFYRVYKYMCNLQIQHLSQDWPAFFFRSFSSLWAIYMSGVSSVQLLSHVWLCDPMDCSMPGFLVLHCLPEFVQTHVHWVNDAIQSSHPLLPSSLLAFNLSQHQGLFQWVGSSHQVAKVLELQLQHQSVQWIFRVDFL